MGYWDPLVLLHTALASHALEDNVAPAEFPSLGPTLIRQWLPPDKLFPPFALLVVVSFTSLFLIAWNFYFPAKTEQWL